MVDIASLAIQIDTSDVARAESDLAKLNGAGTKAEKAAKGVEGAFTGAAKAAGIYRDAAGRLREANGKFVTEARKVELGLKGIGDQAKKAGAEFNGLSNVAGKVGASIVAALSVREVYQATEAYTSISNRLRLVTDSAGAFAAAQAAVFRVAQEGRQPLTETAELYQRIATNQKQLGLTGEGVARVTETISKSLAVSGASAATAAGALTQLGQAFASGTLRGEELNSVLEGAPALAQTLARGLNVTVGELRNLGAEGKLTAEQVVGALLSQSEAMDKAFEKLAPNISGALTTVGNSFTQLIGKMDETSGASSDTASAIMDVAEILSDPATVEAAQIMGTGVAKGIGFIAEAATTTVGVVKWMAEELAATFNGIASDDRVRLEDELVRLQEMRESGPAGRLVFFGRDGIASYKGDAEIDAEIAKIQQALKAYDELGAAAGRTGDASAASTPKIEAFRTGTASLGTAAAEAAGKTDKQATAFKSLMDGLFPAEAAQRKYNEQVALLDKYLDGDQLAKAIDRLNASLYAGDATGPADAIEDYIKQFEKLHDELNPAEVAAREYGKQQDLLNDIIARGGENAGKAAIDLELLRKKYEDNTQETSQWAEWTESALERVDGAFADAWRNIGDGFSSFADSLKNAFRQMLAELAHMAITRPIVMQIGAALGIGGGGSGGILSSLGGAGGGGGFNPGQLLQYAQTGYSLMTGVGPAAMAGYQSGGIMGGLQGVGSYYGNLASSAWGTASSWFGGGAASSAAAAQTAGAAAGNSLGVNAGMYASGGSGAAAGGMSLSALATPAAIVAAVYAAVSAYNAQKAGYRPEADIYKSGDREFKGATGIGNAVGNHVVYTAAKINEELARINTQVFGKGFIGRVANIGSTIVGTTIEALFGGGWQTKDVGLALSATGGDFVGQQYEYMKRKGGLLGKNKKKTVYSDLDPETLSALQSTYDATEAGVADLFAELSLSVEEGTLDGLQIARKQISTKGKTDEEIQKAISEWFGEAADAMSKELNRVFDTGLDLDLAGMQEFVGNLLSVNEAIRYLNLGLFEASVAGGKMAEELSALAGGFDALAQNTATYQSAFFTAAEQQANALDAVRRQFEKLDIALPATRAEFRRVVEALDLTTATGREMFATMTSLAGSASAAYSALEAQLMGAVQSSFAAVQRSVAAQRKAIADAFSARSASLNDMAQTASASLSGMTGVANSLDAALKRLRGSSDDAVRMLRAQAVATLQSALSLSRSGQSLAGVSGLQDALDVASEMDAALYGSLEDFQREQGRTAGLIAELEKVNGKQLTAQETLLQSLADQLAQAQKQYDAQVSGLDAQLSYAQAQLDALLGIDQSVMGVTAAIAAMNASVVAALKSLPTGAAQANTPENNRAIIETIYKSVLGRGTQGDEAGAAFWGNALQTGQLEYDQIAAAIAKGAATNSAESAATKSSASSYLSSNPVATKPASTPTASSASATVSAIYQSVLGRSADAAGAAFWADALTTGKLSTNDIAAAIAKGAAGNAAESSATKQTAEQYLKKLGIPGFATGGLFGGGARIVGERGPELEVTGPSRIYSASQTAAMLGGGGAEVVAELRVLRARLDTIEANTRANAQHASKSTRILERVTQGGEAMQTVEATA